MRSMCATRPSRQGGASLITAVFIITAMALIGALVVRLSVNTQITTSEELLSARALYAAESGIDWAAATIVAGGNTALCSGTTCQLDGNSWVQVDVVSTSFAGRNVFTIVSTGYSGPALGTASVQRQLQVDFMP